MSIDWLNRLDVQEFVRGHPYYFHVTTNLNVSVSQMMTVSL